MRYLSKYSIGCIVALAVSLPFAAVAQDYPVREIGAICLFPPGSGADVQVRYYAAKLSQLAGKPVVVENRGGAQGNIGVEYVARSKPDGYTVLFGTAATQAGSKHFFKSLPFDAINDFAPIASLSRSTFALVVNAEKGPDSVAKLTDLLKKGTLKGLYGSNTNTATIAAELYRDAIGAKMDSVLYRGIGEMVNDLIGGHIDFAFLDAGTAVAQSKAGKVRILAVTSSARSASLPDIPTMGEAGYPRVEIMPWWGVFVPKDTPQPVIDKLAGLFKQITALPETKAFVAGFSAEAAPGGPAELEDMLRKDLVLWGEYTKIAKIEPQ